MEEGATGQEEAEEGGDEEEEEGAAAAARLGISAGRLRIARRRRCATLNPRIYRGDSRGLVSRAISALGAS